MAPARLLYPVCSAFVLVVCPLARIVPDSQARTNTRKGMRWGGGRREEGRGKGRVLRPNPPYQSKRGGNYTTSNKSKDKGMNLKTRRSGRPR